MWVPGEPVRQVVNLISWQLRTSPNPFLGVSSLFHGVMCNTRAGAWTHLFYKRPWGEGGEKHVPGTTGSSPILDHTPLPLSSPPCMVVTWGSRQLWLSGGLGMSGMGLQWPYLSGKSMGGGFPGPFILFPSL